MYSTSNFTRIEGIAVFKIISSALSVIITAAGIALLFKPMGISISFGTVMLSLISIATGLFGIYVIFIKSNGRSLKFSCVKIRILMLIFVVELCSITLFGMGSISKMVINSDMNRISDLREICRLNDYNTYYPVTEELRPEIMYAAGKRIMPLDFDSADVANIERPYILILSKPVEEYPLLERFKVTKLQRYDANWWKKDSDNYNDNLVKDIYFIE